MWNVMGKGRETVRKNLSIQAGCSDEEVAIEGIEPEEIQKQLFDKYNIYTISVNWENIIGISVTPNVYTSTNNLDRFIGAVHEIAKKR
jgi:selenocysteine lyase/cysteine desulfurase